METTAPPPHIKLNDNQIQREIKKSSGNHFEDHLENATSEIIILPSNFKYKLNSYFPKTAFNGLFKTMPYLMVVWKPTSNNSK